MTIRDELSAEEIGCFRRSGYTVVRGLLTDPELSRLRDAFDSLDTTDQLRVDDFAKRLVVTRNLWQHIPGLETIVRRLGLLAGRLMGADEVRLLDDLALVKPPREVGGQPTVWHQDAPNFPFDRRGFLTFWIAVDDISLDQGPLTLLPGSHRLGLLGSVDGGGEETTLATFLTEDDQPYVGEPTTTALAAGDATVHDGSLLHSAGANRTSWARRGWGVRFIPASTLYTGASHQLFDDLNLKPFERFEHENFPLIRVS
ncbi:phytanoyl-CoA dioxygenase family protein [Salinispora fenicalii]|uniref:phytanoyl-CoA dioxygenase family protein n=1 Tax=Salinispora fenicalii TaxID=1137263 RepID=UPI00036F2F72|nr:phytanoyl-CoA dioxygenase family protein [Salinispora fenicalii]